MLLSCNSELLLPTLDCTESCIKHPATIEVQMLDKHRLLYENVELAYCGLHAGYQWFNGFNTNSQEITIAIPELAYTELLSTLTK